MDKKTPKHQNTDYSDHLRAILDCELEYQKEFYDQVYLPSVHNTINAHKENLKTAAELLENNLKQFGPNKPPVLPKRLLQLPKDQKVEEKETRMIFGGPLTEEWVKVFNDLVSIIRTQGIDAEGIFRQGGDVLVINRVKKMYNCGTCNLSILKSMLERKAINIHGIASLLKCMLRELQTPLLTYELFDDFVATAEISDQEAMISRLRTLVSALPTLNQKVLKKLLNMLTDITKKNETNKMTNTSLAIVFSINVLRTADENPLSAALSAVKVNKCFENMLIHHKEIFLRPTKPKISDEKRKQEPVKDDELYSEMNKQKTTRELTTTNKKVSGNTLLPELLESMALTALKNRGIVQGVRQTPIHRDDSSDHLIEEKTPVSSFTPSSVKQAIAKIEKTNNVSKPPPVPPRPTMVKNVAGPSTS
jgi:hypothetical protein